MLNFFETIIEFVKMLFEFVVNTITSLANAIATLAGSIPIMTTLAGQMPYFLASSFFIAVALIVVNYIIGRGNQS